MYRKRMYSPIIVSAGYDDFDNILEVEFRSGVWQYKSVPEGVWEEFQNSRNKGHYFATYIRPFYDYRKVS